MASDQGASLRLLGDSKHGSVGVAANLCTAHNKAAKAAIGYTAQNGIVLHIAQALRTTGCP